MSGCFILFLIRKTRTVRRTAIFLAVYQAQIRAGHLLPRNIWRPVKKPGALTMIYRAAKWKIQRSNWLYALHAFHVKIFLFHFSPSLSLSPFFLSRIPLSCFFPLSLGKSPESMCIFGKHKFPAYLETQRNKLEETVAIFCVKILCDLIIRIFRIPVIFEFLYLLFPNIIITNIWYLLCVKDKSWQCIKWVLK